MYKRDKVAIYTPDELMPSERALVQLALIASDKRIASPVVGLIDIHDKFDNDFPTGAVAVSPGHIFPQLMVSGPNCGMRMLELPFTNDRVTPVRMNELFSKLADSICLGSLTEEKLALSDVKGIMREGAGWVLARYKDCPDDLDNVELRGNAFNGVPGADSLLEDAVPKHVMELSRRRLGILGGGNHFIELQTVEEVFDEKNAGVLGIKKNGCYILAHSGSGGFGAMLTNLYSPRTLGAREPLMLGFVAVERMLSSFNRSRLGLFREMMFRTRDGECPLFGLEAGSSSAGLYLSALMGGANFAYANRALISYKIKKAVSGIFGPETKEVRTLYDLSHMSINLERHSGSDMWVHRTGGVRALPPGKATGTPFEDTGTPVFLPGSMGDPTYISLAMEGNSRTYNSAGHGSGRIRKDKIGEVSSTREELVDLLKGRGITLYKGNSKKIVRQDPRCFKNVGLAADYLSTIGLARKVAKLKPLAVLKG
ncbi:MAG: RtcB family protein [Candidatus Omnitrophica bacterium]|nr:RtcB family protein [Candidatus Omnitrophota bacterium]